MDINDDSFLGWSDSGYPRPQLCRPSWLSLDGPWAFTPDPDDRGADLNWQRDPSVFTESITVPFPPGSDLSGIAPQDCDVVWYRRVLTAEELAAAGDAGDGQRTLLHFEAVDHVADVWVNGEHVAHHRGGYTPFSADVTRCLRPVTPTDAPAGSGQVEIVVRAEDHRTNIDQPRGKQDWRSRPHGIWYERSTGIWRDVWLETVPAHHITELTWSCDLEAATVTCDLATSGWAPGSRTRITLSQDGLPLASTTVELPAPRHRATVHLEALRNRMEWDGLVWAPGSPRLVDAVVELLPPQGRPDRVVSYLGLRSARAGTDYLHVNGAPVYVRAVLDQGYWPSSYFTAPDPQSLRADLELARDLGFNTVRVHQRTADRRFLTWADRLGIMVWGEFASPFAFSRPAVAETLAGWQEAVRRDLSHPCVVAWLPVNESWGVPGLATDPAQCAAVDALVCLTRALDPTRPVLANDGWEQLDTDIIGIHDYGTTAGELRVNYADDDAVARTLAGTGPQGRRLLVRGHERGERPVIITEFGGISLSSDDDEAWGYAVASGTRSYESALAGLFGALYDSPVLAGVCYTQLTDTAQETNGLCYADRTPKLPVERIRALVEPGERFASQIRPRVIREVSSGESRPAAQAGPTAQTASAAQAEPASPAGPAVQADPVSPAAQAGEASRTGRPAQGAES